MKKKITVFFTDRASVNYREQMVSSPRSKVRILRTIEPARSIGKNREIASSTTFRSPLTRSRKSPWVYTRSYGSRGIVLILEFPAEPGYNCRGYRRRTGELSYPFAEPFSYQERIREALGSPGTAFPFFPRFPSSSRL